MERFYRVQEKGSRLRYHNSYLLCVKDLDDARVPAVDWYGEDCDLWEVIGEPVSELLEYWTSKSLKSYLVKVKRAEVVGTVTWKGEILLRDGRRVKPKKRWLRSLINYTNGTIFSVTFTKRTTGEERKMVCRTGVRKGVKGVGMSYDPKEKDLVVVFDMQKKGFRTIPLEGIKEIKVRGLRYITQ